MIWLIGARWKCGNAWSRSVLIVPSPFYAQIILLVFARVSGNLVDLTRNWYSMYIEVPSSQLKFLLIKIDDFWMKRYVS